MEAMHCVVMLLALGTVGVRGDDYWGYWLPPQTDGVQGEYALHFSPNLWRQVESSDPAVLARLLNDELLRGDLSFEGLKRLHLFVGDQELDERTSQWFMEALLKSLDADLPNSMLGELGKMAQAQIIPRQGFPSGAAMPDYKRMANAAGNLVNRSGELFERAHQAGLVPPRLDNSTTRRNNSSYDPRDVYSGELVDAEQGRVGFQQTSDRQPDPYASNDPYASVASGAYADETSPRANRPRTDLSKAWPDAREAFQISESANPRVAASTQQRGGSGLPNSNQSPGVGLTRTSDNYSGFPMDNGARQPPNFGGSGFNGNQTAFPASNSGFPPAGQANSTYARGSQNSAMASNPNNMPLPPNTGNPANAGTSPYGSGTGYAGPSSYSAGSAYEPGNHANRFTAMAFIVASIAIGGNVYQFMNQLRMERRFQRLLYRMQDRQEPPSHLAVTAFEYDNDGDRDQDDEGQEYAGGSEERRRRRRSA